MRVRLLAAVAAALVLSAACNGSNSPTAPTPVASPTPTPTPAPAPAPPAIQRVTVFGVVTNANTRAAVGGATVTVTSATSQTNVSGTTDGNGYYSLPGVGTGPVTMELRAPGYNPRTERPTISTDQRVDASMVPFWTASGVGNTVFDMPTYVQRVRITGRYDSNSSNFIVRIGGRLVINELLGRGWSSTTYNGLHLTSGGIVEITNSRDVAWTFTQEQ